MGGKLPKVAPNVEPNLLSNSSPCNILVGVKMLWADSWLPVAVISRLGAEVCAFAQLIPMPEIMTNSIRLLKSVLT